MKKKKPETISGAHTYTGRVIGDGAQPSGTLRLKRKARSAEKIRSDKMGGSHTDRKSSHETIYIV